jgi:hypothetical protein
MAHDFAPLFQEEKTTEDVSAASLRRSGRLSAVKLGTGIGLNFRLAL